MPKIDHTDHFQNIGLIFIAHGLGGAIVKKVGCQPPCGDYADPVRL
jgi:hypothetical protein